MANRLTKRPRALDDLSGIASYIAEDSPNAAHRFLDAAESLFSLIAAQPGIGATYQHATIDGLRAISFGGRFRRYVVFYEASGSEVTTVRVLDGARDLSVVLERE